MTKRNILSLTLALGLLIAVNAARAKGNDTTSGSSSASLSSSTKAVQQEKKTDSLLKDFDSLGGNDVLFEKAKALHPETTVRAVQNRVVPRRKRLEIAPEYANVFGGDPYNKTQNVGANLHFHFTPQWSVGVKYNYAFNKLSSEAEAMMSDQLVNEGRAIVADVDYPKSQYMALLNWYPFYGKMNLWDLGISHFDVYTILGYGQMQLRSGSTPTYTAGGGVGFWLSQHLTARAEVRYQSYKAKHYTGETAMNTTVLGLQIGYLL